MRLIFQKCAFPKFIEIQNTISTRVSIKIQLSNVGAFITIKDNLLLPYISSHQILQNPMPFFSIPASLYYQSQGIQYPCTYKEYFFRSSSNLLHSSIYSLIYSFIPNLSATKKYKHGNCFLRISILSSFDLPSSFHLRTLKSIFQNLVAFSKFFVCFALSS